MGRGLLPEPDAECGPKSIALLRRAPEFRRDLEISRSLGLATTAEFYALPADEQALRIAEWQIERGKCPQCGGDPDECSDPKKAWYPQQTICYPTMERSAAQRRYEALHEKHPWHDGTHTSWAKDRSDQYPYHRDDGVNIWVAPFKSDGSDFLRRSPDEDDEPESESPDEQ